MGYGEIVTTLLLNSDSCLPGTCLEGGCLASTCLLCSILTWAHTDFAQRCWENKSLNGTFTFLHKPLSSNIYCYDPQINSQSQLRQDTTIAQYSQGWS